MKTYEIVVTRMFENEGVTYSKSLPITLPCADLPEKLSKLGINIDNFKSEELDVNLITKLYIDHPLRIYIENSISCRELNFRMLNQIIQELSQLNDDELEQLMLFMGFNEISYKDTLSAIHSFRNADYYDGDGYVSLTEGLLWDGYFDKFFGFPVSELSPAIMRYIDIEMLSDEIVRVNFVASPDERWFLKVRDL
jgi:hypothetical protein